MMQGKESVVVLDGRVTDEKLGELLALQTEHASLDFKRSIDLAETRDRIELAKDVGAFQVAGGYIVIGVDDQGRPTGDMDTCDPALFDEARIVKMLGQYLPDGLRMSTRVAESEGHTVVILYIGAHKDGCAAFRADGQYVPSEGKRTRCVFRSGDIFWRDGTSSVRVSQAGLRNIMDAQIATAKTAWLREQDELNRRLLDGFETESTRTRASLSTLTAALPIDALGPTVLELLRDRDEIAVTHLLRDARERASSAVDRDEIHTELSEILDKLGVLVAVGMEYKQPEFIGHVVSCMRNIFILPITPEKTQEWAYSVGLSSVDKGPRVFVEVLARVYAVGALAVRLGDWASVRALTLQSPGLLTTYWSNWLRAGLTVASRAQSINQRDANGDRVDVSILGRAAQAGESLQGVGLGVDRELVLTSLAQFDVISNLIAIDEAKSTDSSVFYTSWARVDPRRVEPVVERLITDAEMRATVFPSDDEVLRDALNAIERMAEIEGRRYSGFRHWIGPAVDEFMNGD